MKEETAMKKLICVLCAAMLVMLASCAGAEDLTKLTDTELADLNRRVQLEMFRRSVTGEAGVSVPPGEYYVGVDIPAGRYEVSVGDDVPYVEVAIYRANSMFPEYADDSILIGTVNALTQSGVITLRDGDRISMTAHIVVFKVYTGLF